MMHQTLAKCDPDIRKDLLQNVLLTGAGSLMDSELALKGCAEPVAAVQATSTAL